MPVPTAPELIRLLTAPLDAAVRAYDALMNDPPSLKRKVIRGGSWKDIGYYMQTGTRSYEYQDTTKAYIGFRSVMTFLGRGKAVDAEDL